MSDVDVVVVGARCAGSPLAAMLAARGHRVMAIDKASFPSDTWSTHVFQVEGINVLRRLGVLDDLLAESGSPLIRNVRFQMDDLVLDDLQYRTQPGDDGMILNVRRTILDHVLMRHAKAAGAEIREGTKVTGLLWRDGRVGGVEIDGPGGREQVTAKLVVGADGTRSTVAKRVGARKYHRRESGRFGAWGYFEESCDPPFSSFQVVGRDISITAHGDSGLHLIIALPPVSEYGAFRKDPVARFRRHAQRFAWCDRIVEHPLLDDEIKFFRYGEGFLRESAGPGWVLVGDAGHFKDPTPGQGISDAFRQVERLADHIVAGLTGVVDLDTSMHRFWRWRDADAYEKLHWAADLGEPGFLNPLVKEVFHRTLTDTELQPVAADVFAHRRRPSELATPAVAAKAAASMLGRGTTPPREVVRDFVALAATDRARAAARTAPEYEDVEPVAPAIERDTLTKTAATIDGLRVPLLVGGPDSDEAVVFVHGNPGAGEDFADIAGSVASFARVLAPDLPGFGQADKPADVPYSVPFYADTIGQLLDDQGIRRIHLVLHDFGGPWGLEYAVRHPERIASLTLVNIGVPLGYRWHVLAKIWQTPKLGELFMSTGNRRSFGFTTNLRMSRPVPDRHLDRMWEDFDEGTRHAVLSLYRATPQEWLDRAGYRIGAALRRVAPPTLVVWGGEDPFVGEHLAQRQRAVFPDARVCVFDESGHFPFLDDPERFAATVVPFLREYCTER